MSSALTLIVFWGLVAHAASSPTRREKMRQKSRADWALELSNLLVQGALIPLVLVVLLARFWGWAWPSGAHVLDLPPVVAFLTSFVGVDYLYYWNHRLLHTKSLWPIHLVHHTSTSMDVFATSRNTIWTSFLIVYVWASSLFVHVLVDARYYLAGAAFTAMLDLWRHSSLDIAPAAWIDKSIGAIFVLPRDHAWHHASAVDGGNYGANLKVWDRIHGTYLGSRPAPAELGVQSDLGFGRRLVWPFPRKS